MSFVLLSMNYHSRFVQGLFRPIHKIRLSTRGKSGKRCICVCSLRDGIFQNQWTQKLARVHLSAARRQWLVLWSSYLTARWDWRPRSVNHFPRRRRGHQGWNITFIYPVLIHYLFSVDAEPSTCLVVFAKSCLPFYCRWSLDQKCKLYRYYK